MNKYFLTAVFLGFSLILSGCGQNSGDVDKNASIIFFYGQECPHCKIVEKYIEENKIKEKVDFSEGEVYHNKNNSAFLAEKAGKCGIDTKSIGVPLLWADDKCYVGDKDVIEFFKNKIK
ncbi:MAG: hypothetical protein WA055_01480 [Candidatus Moraniibacteriota bacterium]